MLSEAKVTEIYDMAADFCKKNDIKLTLFRILAYTAESLQGHFVPEILPPQTSPNCQTSRKTK